MFPGGVPDCTTNDSGPVTTLLVVVTISEPLAVAPDAKHAPAVMNSMPDTFNDPSLFTENVVTKLNPEAAPLPPLSTACQVPLAVVGAVFVGLLPPQPERVNSSARNTTIASRFMFTFEMDWNPVVRRDAGRPQKDVSEPCPPLYPNWILCHPLAAPQRLTKLYLAADHLGHSPVETSSPQRRVVQLFNGPSEP